MSLVAYGIAAIGMSQPIDLNRVVYQYQEFFLSFWLIAKPIHDSTILTVFSGDDLQW